MPKAVAHTLAGTFGGVTILEALNQNEFGTHQAFRVCYACCGTEAVMSRSQVLYRRSQNSVACRRCASQDTIMKARPYRVAHTPDVLGAAYGVTPPTWPVPPTVLLSMHAQKSAK